MSTESVARQRCLQHSERQAVACCPGCGHFFCRECITEHDDRVLCTACLKKSVKPADRRRMKLAGVAMAVPLFIGIFAIWLFFYLCGSALLAIPTKYHDGTVWKFDEGQDE